MAIEITTTAIGALMTTALAAIESAVIALNGAWITSLKNIAADNHFTKGSHLFSQKN